MPLNIGKYLGDTTHLTTPQHGAYLLLLMAYWRRGGPLPADDARLAATAKVTPQEWKKLKPVLSEFFSDRDGYWHQKRADEELETARTKMAAKSRAGKTGAQNRWHKDGETDDRTNGKQDGTGMADASDSHRQTDAPLPSTLVPVSEEAKASSGAAGAIVVDQKPAWWPQRDRYGRVITEITEKLIYDVGKAVLGQSAGGMITQLRKAYPSDARAVMDFLLQAHEKSTPKEWLAVVIRDAELDRRQSPKHEIFPAETHH
jgi:uncharacterized protein YdaU (DUF1376 family)